MPTYEFLLQRTHKQKVRIQELEGLVTELTSVLKQKDDQLAQQGVELALQSTFDGLSKSMYDLIAKVAKSQSKFAKEARELL